MALGQFFCVVLWLSCCFLLKQPLWQLDGFHSLTTSFIIIIFHRIYIDYFLSPPPAPPRYSSFPYPFNFIFSTTPQNNKSKNKQTKSNKQNIKYTYKPPPNPKYKNKEKNVNSITPGHGVCFGVWLINPMTLHWRKLIFPLSVSILVRDSWLEMRLCVQGPFFVWDLYLGWILTASKWMIFCAVCL